MEDITLSPDQQTAAEKILSWHHVRASRQMTLGGLAGTGKSTLIRYLMEHIEDAVVCAPTGKAVSRLKQLGVDAERVRTVHSLIYIPYEVENEDGTKEIQYKLRQDGMSSDLDPSLVICDESSMLSTWTYNDLMSFEIPVLFVGDHGQLEPIGSNPRLMMNPDIRLEKIHRQAEGNPILQLAFSLRQGEAPQALMKKFRKFECSIITRDRLDLPALLKEDDWQIICGYNNTRHAINSIVREIKGFLSEIPQKDERLICLKNNAPHRVFNGQMATVLANYGTKKTKFGEEVLLYLDLEDGRQETMPCLVDQFGKQPIDLDDFNSRGIGSPLLFDFAPAVTCHKCVTSDTLVETKEGLLPIAKIKKTGKIATPFGARIYCNFVENPPGPVIHFQTRDGYSASVTPDHKVEVWDGQQFSLKPASQIELGEWMRLKIGATIETTPLVKLPPLPKGDIRARVPQVPTTMSKDFAEFLGLMVADGTIWKSGFRLLKSHCDVIARFKELCQKLFNVEPRECNVGKTFGWEVNSVLLAKWLLGLGGLAPNAKDIPESILRSSLSFQNHFLRGLFEDGSVAITRDKKVKHIEWSTSYGNLSKKVQVMLLRAGILSCRANYSGSWRISIYGEFHARFISEIGFIAALKNQRLQCPYAYDLGSGRSVPIDSALIRSERKRVNAIIGNNSACGNFLTAGKVTVRIAQRLPVELTCYDRAYHCDQVKKIEHGIAPTMCVEVPDGHRFLQNGFPHGNSQGDQFDNVLVVEEIASSWNACRWRYTAGTRAAKRLLWCMK